MTVVVQSGFGITILLRHSKWLAGRKLEVSGRASCLVLLASLACDFEFLHHNPDTFCTSTAPLCP